MNKIDTTEGRFEYDGANGVLVVRVRLRDVRSDETRAALMEAVNGHFVGQPPKAVVFDIAKHKVLSSGTLAAFLRCRKNGAEVCFRNATAHVVEILERTNLDQLIGIRRD